jgi:hypothetical protein
MIHCKSPYYYDAFKQGVIEELPVSSQTAPDRTAQFGFYWRVELTFYTRFYNAGGKLRSPIRVWLTMAGPRRHPSPSTQVLISHQFPIRCTRQEHNPETYFLALTTFVDTWENPEWRRLEKQGPGPCGSSVQASGLKASTADPQNCFYPSWLGGIKTHAPDSNLDQKKKSGAMVTEPHVGSILLLVPGPEKQSAVTRTP